MKISILLPYKENFSPAHAGAVSIFVNDITNVSIFKKSTLIFGNTHSKKKLSSNYINLSLHKKLLQSTSKQYVDSFINHEKKINSDLIEVHNRPNYINLIRKEFKKKLILYFHNDPLSMNGSKKVSERLYLLNKVDRLVFNSQWSRRRFFVNIENDFLFEKTYVCYQSAPKTKVNFTKKQKIISFVGKLNSAKGYDLFGLAIQKILDKHIDWKAVVIGDEPREKIFFKHKNLQVVGFKTNKFILNFLKKVSISVVSSRWNEPFGRTSLEAASRGSAVIISNRGGLPETAKDAIILKTLTVNNIYKSINRLINNKKLLLSLQKKNYNSFKLNHNYVCGIIDGIRNQFINERKISTFNVDRKSILKILHITNLNERFNGRLHYNTGRRLNNGFIRLGHNVLTVSDRDIVNKAKNIGDFKGTKALQNIIIDSYNNFKPNLVILGHADAVQTNTLEYLKEKNKELKTSQWFLDPLGKHGPDYIKNTNRIEHKKYFMDTTFLTTDPNSISLNIKNSFFMPNPCDHSFETLKNYENDNLYDVFFAMSHGVHRGQLKKGKKDDREVFINKLLSKNQDINFDIYGMNNIQPIWGQDFISKISNSSMGLNLSRGKPVKYYSSDRIAQLLGNGLLTFIHKDTMFNDFLGTDEIVLYKNLEDLSDKINRYKIDKKNRKRIAKNGKNAYFNNFNSTKVSKYIIDKTFGVKSKESYIWD
ncbi:glycosyltransferase [Candidatus Pelagibacter bacterium]|nr:glycosyltransferase [Candidatus Pelagibacter bacterium]